MNINVTTYLNQLGYGVVGLNLVKSLARAGHEVALWVNGPGQAPVEDRALLDEAIERSGLYDSSAPSIRVAHQWDMAHRVGHRLHAGYTFFELDRLGPVEAHQLRTLDRVFVASTWAVGVLVESGVPSEIIRVATPGHDPHIFNPQVTRGLLADYDEASRRLRERNTTVFLSCGKWEVRKGHDLLAEAFNHAFGPEDNVFLVMNCSNPLQDERENERWTSLYLNTRLGSAGKVFVFPHRLPRQQDVARLMALADCGVFFSRAEGWNLELLEMMATGKTVIATDYSAHTAFCDAGNCLLVHIDGLETACDGTFFKGDGGRWAELGDRQVEHLIAHMRAVHALKQSGQLKPNAEGLATAARMTWDTTAKEILKGL